MDFNNDAWTYSDPSLESLQLNDENTDTPLNNKPTLNLETTSLKDSTSLLQSPIDLESPLVAVNSQRSLPRISSPPKAITIPTPALISGRRSSFSSSQHSLTKSAPANPLTTKHDVESVPLSNSSASSVNDTVSDLVQSRNQSTPTQLTPSGSGNFFNNMFNSAAASLSFNKTTPDNSKLPSTSASSDADSTIVEGSPSMLSFRRTKKEKKRNFSLSSVENLGPSSPLNEDNKPYGEKSDDSFDKTFDTNLYVDEKFRNTNQRYATITRNEEFHKLFKSIPEHERLLDDYSCAINREILLQGRLYVTEYNICFNSNLLVYVTNLVIPFNEVLGFEKTATAGLFNNGIIINLKHTGKHSFASFISRDATFDRLEEIWKAAIEHDSEVPSPAKTFLDTHGAAFISKNMSLVSETYDTEYASALMSIDGDTPKPRRTRSLTDDDEEDEEGEEEEESDDTDGTSSSSNYLKVEPKLTNQKVFKLNADSKYKYDGPSAHHATKSPYDPGANKETILAKENLKCPPGLLYEFLFGKENALTLEFLKSQDSSEFSEFSSYEPNEDNLQERSYQYRKALNYSVGPKSTKCLVKETIENLDFHGYINVITTTQTPDVPSGGSFTVKTRYIITWNSDNTSNLIASFWVHWTASSWMKAVIEKSCKSGQEAAIKDLVALLKRYVDENSHSEVETVSLSTEDIIIKEELEEPKAEKVQEVKTSEESTTVTISHVPQISVFNVIVLTLLSFILAFQVLIFKKLDKTPGREFSLGSIQKIDPATEDLIFKGEEILLWNWVNDRAGKVNGSKDSKTIAIQKDIDELINKWANGELNTKDGEILIKDFEDKLNDYIHDPDTSKTVQKKLKAENLKRSIRALL